MPHSLWPHELWLATFFCPWDSPGKNTWVCCHFLLQGALPNPGSNQVSCIGRWILHHEGHLESSKICREGVGVGVGIPPSRVDFWQPTARFNNSSLPFQSYRPDLLSKSACPDSPWVQVSSTAHCPASCHTMPQPSATSLLRIWGSPLSLMGYMAHIFSRICLCL